MPTLEPSRGPTRETNSVTSSRPIFTLFATPIVDGYPDGPNDIPPEVRCLELHLRESLVDTSEGSLMVPIMAHHRVPCTGPTHGAFLRPAQSWLLRRCSLHAPAVAEAVLSNRGADEKLAAGPYLRAVSREC